MNKNTGKIHQRQEELKGWNQAIISELKCLVLGVGGLGTNIAINLCRLGVKKIVLVDMDVVDEHNLNRQMLFRSEHIGRPKVECAFEELQRHNNVSGTEIEYCNIDAVKKWDIVTNLMVDCDVVFNTIDHGDYFDYAICHCADLLHKPLVLGGTEPFYGHTVSYFLQGIQSGEPRYWDCHDLTDVNKIYDTSKTLEYADLSFLPKDSHPEKGGSTVYSAGTCSHLMTSAMINYMLHLEDDARPNPPKQVIFNLLTMESVKWF